MAEPDDAVAARILGYLEEWQLQPTRLTDGGEALLGILRSPPALVVVGGHLPGVAGPALTEIVRRVPSLGAVRIVRVVSLDEPTGAPEFEADATVGPAELPEVLGGILKRLGVGVAPTPPAPRPEVAADHEQGNGSAATSEDESSMPELGGASSAPEDSLPEKRVATPKAEGNGAEASEDPRVKEARRLARIIVSDIVLYNEERFDRAVQEGNLLAALQKELDEGRGLFRSRIPEEVRAQRDFLVEELDRVVEKRRGTCGPGAPGATA